MKDIITGFREVVQDLLVPELRAVKVELQLFKEEVHKQFEEFAKRFEKIDQRFERVFLELEGLKIGQREILNKLDLDKRLTKLETVLERAGLLQKELVVREEKEVYPKK